MIVYGCGQLASSAVRDLSGAGEEITIIGTDRNRLERLSEFDGVTAELLAAPAMQDYLLRAGVSHADAFLALSDDDHENLMVAQIARDIFNVPYVVCHVAHPDLHMMYTALGMNVIGYSRGLLQDIRQVMDV